VSAVVIGLLLGGTAFAPPAGAAASFADADGCDEHQAFVEGDESAVAARLPDRYAPVRVPASGRPLLFVRALRCRSLTIDGHAGPAVMASYGVVIESPDGRGCGSGGPSGSVKGDQPPICNWYTLAWLANDRRVVDWLKDGTPGFPAVHEPGLDFDIGAFDAARGGAPFHFHASGESPFTIEAVGRERPGTIPVQGGYWADTPKGTVKVAFSTFDITSGDATGAVSAAPGSALAELLGADERPYVPGYSSFAAERWDQAVYRKQVLEPSERTSTFAGTCSVEGTVAFAPPATNAPQPLTYEYQGRGTCTGTLNGRSVSSAPVALRTSGRSEGGCQSAKTTEPGRGALSFDSGEAVAYTFDFTSTATEVQFTFYGERSGTGSGRGTFATPRTSPDITERCNGEGVRDTPLDITLTTETPLASDDPAAGGGQGNRKPRPRLRLRVSPRTVRAGRRTRFAFRVRKPDGSPAAGAYVRLAGRRVRTGAAGTAAITATLHQPGEHPAGAAKRGFRQARGAVRVRRR